MSCRSGSRIVLLLGALSAVPFAGCLDMPTSWFGGDPLAQSTFEDAGSNNTTWALRVAGHFHLPNGTRIQLDADNRTCTTGPVVPLARSPTYACVADRGRAHLYNVTLVDHGDDGRISQDDHLLLVPGPGHGNGTLFGPHVMHLALHRELPLFVLDQEFGPTGPVGGLRVELLA